jgi:hypothetical protein
MVATGFLRPLFEWALAALALQPGAALAGDDEYFNVGLGMGYSL